MFSSSRPQVVLNDAGLLLGGVRNVHISVVAVGVVVAKQPEK